MNSTASKLFWAQVKSWLFLVTCLFAPYYSIVAAFTVLSRWINLYYRPVQLLVADSISLAFALVLLFLCSRYIERDRLSDYGLCLGKGITAVKEFLAGALIGTLLVSAVTGSLWAMGCFHVVSITPQNDFSAMVIPLIIAALLEEVIFRGYIFRILEKAVNTRWALILSSLMFGAVHLTNFKGHESAVVKLLSCLTLGLDAGLLFGAAFLLRRRLWFPLGIHAFWNLFEGPFYGTRISGLVLGKPLIESNMTGPDYLTGGIFGPEASLIELTLCLVLAFLILQKSSTEKLSRRQE